MRDYQKLLKSAPSHDSPEFIDFLRKHNEVVFENDQWIVIKNVKYWTPEKEWLTAFWKGCHCGCIHQEMKDAHVEWYDDIDILWHEFGDWEWLKKAKSKQTVGRFHIHLIRKTKSI